MESFMTRPWPLFTDEPHCGAATWVFISKRKNRLFTPINQIWDINAVLSRLEKYSKEIKTGLLGKAKVYAKLAVEIIDVVTEKNALEEFGFKTTVKTLVKFLVKPSYDSLGKIRRRLLLVGSMAFMDCYNFDLERVKRCIIHYVTPDLRIIPFCTYNVLHRKNVEKKFSTASKIRAG
jgi:uncharacterized radical SAM superfamily Fe-S cluster-containing enzyme